MAPPAEVPTVELTDMASPAKAEGAGDSAGPPGGVDASWRVVVIGDAEASSAEARYAGNKVRTSKYTLLTFLPRNLWEQFHRVAYIYFAIIMILNQIPVLAVFGRTASLFPLLFVLIVTAIKDGYEDWGRRRSDRKVNAAPCFRLTPGGWAPCAWRELRVGDVVRLTADEVVPADLVLLATAGDSGTAYTETMNLDGETNLKSRHARLETQRAGEGVAGRVVCEPPNRNIYEFTAYLDLGAGRVPLSAGNMLLRGCVLRNTEWAVGVVAYAGPDTKAMLNNSGAQSKRSRLEKQMNRETLVLAGILGGLCAVGAIGMGVWLNQHDTRRVPWYGRGGEYHGRAGEALLNFFSLIILLQILVPISLYISLELVRLFQALLMQCDLHLYYAPADERLKCRALNINEDLGQIRYVFSDKTGTLTQNRMVFHAASIAGVDYSHATRVEAAPLVPASAAPKDALAPEIKAAVSSLGPATPPPPTAWQPASGAMVDARLLAALADPHQGHAVRDFLIVLAACNTVVPTTVKRTPETPPSAGTPATRQGSFARRAFESPQVSSLGRGGAPAVQLEYQAESPDELAFVAAAAAYGYTLLERTSEAIVIDAQGTREKYSVLGVHEFDSSRKRMSVVVRAPDGGVRLLVKGADSAMVPLLGQLYTSKGPVHSRRPSWDGKQLPLPPSGGHRRRSSREGDIASSLLTATQAHLDQYAREGLRTLVLAHRAMPPEEVAAWADKYRAAATAMVGRAAALAALAAETETGLTLLGATGIEDKLQDGVPATIALLRRAGLKVWVLTGDKQETAVSIAFSCQLLTDEMTPLVICDAASKDACAAALASATAQYLGGSGGGVAKGARARRKSGDGGGQYRAVEGDRVARLQQSSSSSGAGVSASERVQRWGGAGGATNGEAEAAGPSPRQLALVIDGQSLQYALSEELEDQLFAIARACRAVVCCRVAPLQKAGVVALIKRKAKEMTLAIGDGANDVSMIQMADIGVGISGQEGRQAVMASDFAIAQFRFLGRLLLVHGHWCYQRLGYMVLYNFYKNAIFVLLLFWFIFFTQWSSISALSSWNLVFFSLLYTSLPTIAVASLDQDVSAATLLHYPHLYAIGQDDVTYNRTMFWVTMADTTWQSLVLFFAPYFTFAAGSPATLWEVGNLWCLLVTLTVTLHLAMDVYHWTYVHHAVVWLSLLITVVTMLILDAFPASQQYWVMYHAWGDARYWLNVLLVPLVCVLPRYLVKVGRQWYFPTAVHVARAKQLAHQGGGFSLVGGATQLAGTPRMPGQGSGSHEGRQKGEELKDVAELHPNGVP